MTLALYNASIPKFPKLPNNPLTSDLPIFTATIFTSSAKLFIRATIIAVATSFAAINVSLKISTITSPFLAQKSILKISFIISFIATAAILKFSGSVTINEAILDELSFNQFESLFIGSSHFPCPKYFTFCIISPTSACKSLNEFFHWVSLPSKVLAIASAIPLYSWPIILTASPCSNCSLVRFASSGFILFSCAILPE